MINNQQKESLANPQFPKYILIYFSEFFSNNIPSNQAQDRILGNNDVHNLIPNQNTSLFNNLNQEYNLLNLVLR
jgi:hypothetical protein